MAAKSGWQSIAGIKIASTWGTAVAAGVGDRFSGEISPNFNVNELTAREIGSGSYMLSNATRGNYIPTISITADLGYRNGCDRMIAQMLGTSGVPTEVTVGQSDYKHVITFNSTLNSKYITLAYEDGTTTTMEFPTCAVQSIGLSTTSVPGYIDFTAELLAGQAVTSSSTNTNATLATTTFTEGTPELVAVDFSDTFRTNAQSATTLSGSHQYNITGFEMSLNRPQEIIPEIKGSAGNSAPVTSALIEGTFNVTVKELADHAYYTIWEAETAQKAELYIQGTQIGSGTNKGFKVVIPRMVLVQEPQYALSSPGTNTLALNFRLLKAGSNPTGMSNTYPYFEITNTLATSLLA